MPAAERSRIVLVGYLGGGRAAPAHTGLWLSRMDILKRSRGTYASMGVDVLRYHGLFAGMDVFSIPSVCIWNCRGRYASPLATQSYPLKDTQAPPLRVLLPRRFRFCLSAAVAADEPLSLNIVVSIPAWLCFPVLVSAVCGCDFVVHSTVLQAQRKST